MSDRDIINGRPIGAYTTFYRQVLFECKQRTLTNAELVETALIPTTSGLSYYGEPPLSFLKQWGQQLDVMRPSFDYKVAKQALDKLANSYPFEKKRGAGFAIDAAKQQLDEIRHSGFGNDVILDLTSRYAWNIYKGNFSAIVRSVHTPEGVTHREVCALLNEVEPHIKNEIRKIVAKAIRADGIEKLKVRRATPKVGLDTKFGWS